MATTTRTIPARLAGMLERVSAITPGNWYWGGNTDVGDLTLRSFIPGKGAVTILDTVPHYLTAAQRKAKAKAACFQDKDDERAYIRQLENNPELCLAFGNPDGRRVVEARETAIYAVARNQGLPDDTPRSHPDVYRADVIGSRHPNAAFMAASAGDLRAATAALAEIHEVVAAVLAEDSQDSAARAIAAILDAHLGDTETAGGAA